MMDRRVFTAGMAAMLAAPLTGQAQQAGKVYRIGYLGFAPRPPDEAFRRGLRDLGYADGRNVLIAYRWGGPTGSNLDALAQELIALEPSVIVAVASPATRAAKQATQTIPIVMVDVGDPVAYGFVPSLARPGGNLTGMSAGLAGIGPKLLQLLKEVDPRAIRVAALSNAANPGAKSVEGALDAAAGPLGLQIQTYRSSDPDELKAVLSAVARWRADALYVHPDHFLYTQRQQIIEFAASDRIPAGYGLREYVPDGGLLALGANRNEMFRRAAHHVDRILKGAKPADLPVEEPTKFELLINLRTARRLGLTIPPSVLLRADQVIE